jgi:hypothetical protein
VSFSTHGPQHLFVGVEGGQHHDLRRVRPAAQPLGGGEAVHDRHADVHQDHVRRVPVDEFRHL